MAKVEELEQKEEELETAEKVVDKQAEEAAEQERKESEERGLSEEDINKRVEAARKQEKDKLYDTISDLKEQVKALSEMQKEEKEEKEKIQKEADEAAEQKRVAKLSSDEKLAEQLKRFEEQLEKEESRRQELEAKLEKEREERELEVYRQELLREAGDDIIPDLVTGDSREAIERNTAIAKARYQELLDHAITKAKGGKEPTGKGMPRPTNPDPDAMDEEELKGIIPVDPNAQPGEISEEYKTNRKAILSKVALAYQQAQQRGQS